MNKIKPKSIIAFSSITVLLGLVMLGYWTKYLLDGLPLKTIPIAPEVIAAILALTTGIGLFQMRKWALATGILLSGFWMYGCIGGINLVVYDLIVNGKLSYQSPIGALTDAILFVVITIWAAIFVIYLWKMRSIYLQE